jgi:8-oxo-dGTP diphosphatase
VTNSDGPNHPDDFPRHSVSAGGAVIREDGLILAIKRADNGEWVLPGGIVELDEDPRDTVRREVLEETGVTVETERLTGFYKNMRLGVVSLVFRCRPLSGAAHPTEEATEVAWLDSVQVTSRMAEAFAIRLIDALEAGEPPRAVFTTVSTCSAKEERTLSRSGCSSARGLSLPKAAPPVSAEVGEDWP